AIALIERNEFLANRGENALADCPFRRPRHDISADDVQLDRHKAEAAHKPKTVTNDAGAALLQQILIPIGVSSPKVSTSPKGRGGPPPPKPSLAALPGMGP